MISCRWAPGLQGGEAVRRQLGYARYYSGVPECLDSLRLATTARRAREHYTINPGYSLLYPYSDKLPGSGGRIRRGKSSGSVSVSGAACAAKGLAAQDHREFALWKLVRLIEAQYPRALLSAGL